jgi:hypothetical protein
LPFHADPMIEARSSRVIIAHVPHADVRRLVSGSLK